MTEMKNQTINNLMSAIGAEPSEMSAVAAWTGERCWDESGTALQLWTYGEMLELAQIYLENKIGVQAL
jgi:hypothetical protein